jgi:LPP20 lipoprotein
MSRFPHPWVATLLAAWIGCGGCGPRAVRSPDWILGDPGRYPAGHYLTGVGSAPTSGGLSEALKAAAASARAELAQTIEVRVDHIQRLKRESTRTVEFGQEGVQLALETERSALSTFTRTSTDQIVQGIQLKEKYHDEDRGVLYVLAVLDKQQAAARLADQLAALETRIDGLTRDGDRRAAAHDLLSGIRRYRDALGLAVRADILLNQLRVIDPHLAREAVPARLGADVAAGLSQLFLRYGFSVSVDRYPLMEATVREALVSVGLDVRSQRQPGQPGLTLWGAVNVKRGTYPSLEQEREGALHVCRIYLGLKLVDDLTGSIVGQVNLLDNSNAENAALAEERAVRLLRQRILRQLPAALYQALSLEQD